MAKCLYIKPCIIRLFLLTLLSPIHTLAFAENQKTGPQDNDQTVVIQSVDHDPETQQLAIMLKKYQIINEDNPKDVHTLLKLGYIYNELKNYQRSFNSYDQAVQLEPQNIKAWLNRSHALKQLNRFDDALASYNKVIEINPQDPNVWFNRGNLLYGMGRLNEALESYDKATIVTPKDGSVWYNRGLVLEDLGHNKDSLLSYEKAQDNMPGNIYYQARVIYMKNKINKSDKK